MHFSKVTEIVDYDEGDHELSEEFKSAKLKFQQQEATLRALMQMADEQGAPTVDIAEQLLEDIKAPAVDDTQVTTKLLTLQKEAVEADESLNEDKTPVPQRNSSGPPQLESHFDFVDVRSRVPQFNAGDPSSYKSCRTYSIRSVRISKKWTRSVSLPISES